MQPFQPGSDNVSDSDSDNNNNFSPSPSPNSSSNPDTGSGPENLTDDNPSTDSPTPQPFTPPPPEATTETVETTATPQFNQFASLPALDTNAPAAIETKKPGKTKKVILAAVAVLVLGLLAGTGYVFAFYLPNTPENVWKTGLERTSLQLETAVDKISDQELMDSLAKSKLSITANRSGDGDDMAASFDSTYDGTKSDSRLTVKNTNDTSTNQFDLEMKLKTQQVENSPWPNTYLNIKGLSTLGIDGFIPGLSDYDGKWIAIEQDFYKEITEAYGLTDDQDDEEFNVTQADVASIAADVSEVSGEYLFSTDDDKAVLEVKEFVATETSEGIEANRYKVTINEANSIKYCQALVDKLHANDSFLKLSNIGDDEIDAKRSEAKKDCQDPEDDDTYNETFDVWIDRQHKVIHKIRATENLENAAAKVQKEKEDCLELTREAGVEGACERYDNQIEKGESYVEFGQIYKDDKSIQFFVNQVSDTNVDKSKLRSDVTVDIETFLLNGKLTYQDEADDGMQLDVTFKTESFDGEVDAAKPDGAMPIKTVIEDIQAKMQASQPQQLGASTETPASGLNIFGL